MDIESIVMETTKINNWHCYLLLSEDNKRTYVGATINPDRRLRQHNCEISGGAKATKGSKWNRVCYVEGFPDQCSALQFEWKWKYLSKKQKGSALERRKKALAELLTMDKSTEKSVPYSEYPRKLCIVYNDINNDII